MSPWAVGCPMLTAADMGDDSNSKRASQGGRGFYALSKGHGGHLRGGGCGGSVANINGVLSCSAFLGC